MAKSKTTIFRGNAMIKKKHDITEERDSFKPFAYPWAYEAWLKHEQAHWLHSEVPMLEDVKDWKNKLTIEQKQFLTHIFRFLRKVISMSQVVMSQTIYHTLNNQKFV